MTDFIEADALANTPDAPPPTPHEHPAVSSFVATPKMDTGLLEKVRTWMKGGANPNAPVVYKTASGLRRMILFTSNSYKDREGETITSAALKEYEASCYPGEDVYHNDNLLLWWHDDDVPMGTIEAVEYIEPFLVEVAQEIPGDPISKMLWDFADQNGDNAGVSHRFGYLEKDRDDDGTFHRIFKQETSYLPERRLAANDKTYAGVLKPMSTPESRKRLGAILAETTGLKEFEELVHTNVGEARKRLAEMGLQHKAVKPPVPPIEADVVAADVAEDVVEEAVEGEVKADVPLSTLMEGFNRIMALVLDMVDSQMGLMDTQGAMAKSLEALETGLKERQTAEKATKTSLEAELNSLRQQVTVIEKRLSLTGRSVTQEKGHTPKEAIEAVVQTVEKSRVDGELQHVPGFGPLKPPPVIKS